jgi:hypothetical protein
MGSLIEELKRQEEAARAEADRLRARIEELTGALARVEEQVTRLVIAREEVTRVLTEPSATEAAGPSGVSADKPWPASPIGAVTVLPWQEGAEASLLPQAYQDLLEVAADAGRPLRAGEFAAAAGLSTEKAKVEGAAVEAEAAGRAGLAGPVPGGLYTLIDHAGKTGKSGR